MKTNQLWVGLAAIFLVIGIGVSSYLTSHHFDLIYGRLEGKSFCSVSAVMDCDAVNASSFSEIFGIPVAMIAIFAFLVQLLLLVGYRAFSDQEKPRLGRYFFYLTLGNVLFSLYLAFVSSTILKTYCLMCISLYVVSLVLLLCGFKIGGSIKNLGKDLAALFTSGENGGARGVLILLLLIPAGSALGNGMMKQNAGDIDTAVSRSIDTWKSASSHKFEAAAAPVFGDPTSKIEIVEFSDFQCPHCKRAAPTLNAFVSGHKNEVKFIFQNYPLDPACNPSMKPGTGHDMACAMATSALCAHKQGKFLEAEDWIFAHQDTLSSDTNAGLVDALKLDKAAFNTCLTDSAIKSELTHEVNQGIDVKIEGTPTVFFNGKQLPGGFLIPVLEAALKEAKK